MEKRRGEEVKKLYSANSDKDVLICERFKNCYVQVWQVNISAIQTRLLITIKNFYRDEMISIGFSLILFFILFSLLFYFFFSQCSILLKSVNTIAKSLSFLFVYYKRPVSLFYLSNTFPLCVCVVLYRYTIPIPITLQNLCWFFHTGLFCADKPYLTLSEMFRHPLRIR